MVAPTKAAEHKIKPAAHKAEPHPKPHAHPPEKVVERVIVEKEPAPVPTKGLLVGGAAVALVTSAVMGLFRSARGFRGRGWRR